MCKEYLHAENGSCLLAHVWQLGRVDGQKSHIQMLLTMGVRDCPEQVEVYTNVFKCVKCMNEICG